MKDLIEIDQKNAMQVYTSDVGLDPYVEIVKKEVESFVYDTSTAKGRAEIASLANKVAKTKVKLDGFGKELVADWKSKAKVVDATRKKMRDQLDELKILARLPLTQYEEQLRIEEERKAREEEEKKRLAEIELHHEMALLMNAEFDRKKADELARIKAEEDERIKREAEERAEREAEIAAKAKEEAEKKARQAELDKIAAQERSERIEREAKEARERAEKEAKEAEERAKKRAIEAAEEAKQREVEAQKQREKAERLRVEKLEANKKHVAEILKNIKEGVILASGISEQEAKKIVLAIRAGKISNVAINY